jgi:ABC-type Na+ efflux pump permease subunit
LLLALVYLAGALGLAAYNGYADAVTPAQVIWFIVYLVMAMFIFGSLFMAIGAASTDLKDAQGIIEAVMMLFMLPMFVWLPVLRAPESTMAVVASIVPLATPILMTLRLALRAGPRRVADRAVVRPHRPDDRALRVGRRPHLPRRVPHAGKSRRPSARWRAGFERHSV